MGLFVRALISVFFLLKLSIVIDVVVFLDNKSGLLVKASDNWTPTSYDGETKLQDLKLMSYEFTGKQKEWQDIFSGLI